MMLLKAFRIKNFRSIVDTGWQSLSPDNITCLIGQNESGKTSILEGLKVFYTGIISEDVLRSDLSLPEVSCRFSIPEGWLLKVTDNPGSELKELLSRLTEIELTRVWIADLSSIILASGAISGYLDSLEDAWQLYLEDVTSKLEQEMIQLGAREKTLAELKAKESEIKAILSGTRNAGKGFRLFPVRISHPAPEENAQHKLLKDKLPEIIKRKEEISAWLQGKRSVNKAGTDWKLLCEKYDATKKHFADLSVKLEEHHQKMILLMRPEEDDDAEWRNVLDDFRRTLRERDLQKDELARQVALSGYVMEGSSEDEAEQKVNEVIQSYKSQYNSEILGKKYFEHCPVFEFFEDFGSLLPNRIDMEDIISGNEKVEGYKAARNFMAIARLDYTFFQQPSSRILKQKIENLNYSLSRNFQEFWQQSVGVNNKINIQFELDHYSTSYGNKVGKPYLEFWIKDEGERLYPKQRSRGVRWFLSFYLELKAAANVNKQMVLLVDEPGVSLHARAQEDVLKVFEDIKDKIQIIYTTHSPHLVEISKLHRVLAIQRDDPTNLRSATRILDPLNLSSASPDTLSPLQSILGNPVAGEGFSSKKFNLILNDTGSFYILDAVLSLMGLKSKISVIPSTNVSSIPLLCNILMGWGLKYAVMLFNNEKENQIMKILRETHFKTSNNDGDLIIKLPETFLNSEDMLSTLDFKNHILNTREGITTSNSEYVKEKDLPRNFLFSRFLTDVKDGKIKLSDFDEETLENFRIVKEHFRGLK